MNKNSIEKWVLLLILSIIWGSSFILMKKSLVYFSYLEVAFYRLIIAFFSLSPFFIFSIQKLKKNHIIPILIVSLIGTVLPAIIFAYAQNYINSASAGMLNSLTPIFTFLLGLIIYKNRWSNKSLIGIIIGLAGSYILLLPTNTHILQTKYSLLIILATLFYALSINTIKEKLYSLKPLDIAVISSFISFIIPVIFILNNDLSYSLNKINHNFTPFIYIIILGGICTSLAIVLFNYLIQKTSALFGSSTTYLIPVFAILWGTIDNEIINTHEIIGVIIILSGVFIMNYKKID